MSKKLKAKISEKRKSEAICKILAIANKTYYNWKKEERPIMSLLAKYFTTEDLEEFLKTSSIQFLDETEMLKNISSYKLKVLVIVVEKIERFIGNKPINRKEFLYKIRRSLRDMEENEDPIRFLNNYRIAETEAVSELLSSNDMSDVIIFYEGHLSREEIAVMREYKFWMLPVLKNL